MPKRMDIFGIAMTAQERTRLWQSKHREEYNKQQRDRRNSYVLQLAMSHAKRIAEEIIECFKNGHKLLIIGNGGSAAEAQHMAGELVGKFLKDRKALPAIALTTDTSILTAMANDFGSSIIFSRQVEALGKHGDILLCLSTSGKSNNVLLAMDVAREIGLKVIDFPRIGRSTPRIQESQLKLIHEVCKIVEEAFE